MKILDRYLLKESLVPFLIGTGAVTIMLLGGIVYDNANILFAPNTPLLAVFQLLIYRIPYLISLTLPAGAVVASSLVVSRLTRDSEITAVRIGGVPLIRIFAPLLIGAACVSLLNFALSDVVIPRTQELHQKLFYKIIYMQPEPQIRPNVVLRVNNYHIIIGQAFRNKGCIELRDIRIDEKIDFGKSTTIIAEEGIYDAGKWTLKKAKIYQFGLDGEFVSVVSKSDVILNLRAEFGELDVPKLPEAMSAAELKKQIADKKAMQLDTRFDETQLHAKYAIPLACLALTFIAPLLALRFSRSGAYVGVLLSIILVFVYWNTLLLFVKIISALGILPPVVSAWAPNVLFMLAGLWLMRKAE